MVNQKILVTGSQGFIGHNLLTWLRKIHPHAEVVGTVTGLPSACNSITLDVCHAKEVQDAVRLMRPDYIYHAAGILNTTNWDDYYNKNVKSSINILEAVKIENPQARVILLGSAAEYGTISQEDLPLAEDQPLAPVTWYGLSKALQTQVAGYYSSQVDVIMARLFNVIGPGVSEQLSVGYFISQIIKMMQGQAPPILTVGNLSARRDYLYIDDVCSALCNLAQKGRRGQVYNICSGSSISMETLLQQIVRQSKMKITIISDSGKFKKNDVSDIYGSYDKIGRETGWLPSTTIEDGIAQTLSVTMENFNLPKG